MDITKLSTETQIKLIGIFNKAFKDCMDIEATLYLMLAEITNIIGHELKASAGSIFAIDKDGENATLIAGFGYQKKSKHIIKSMVVPEDEVSELLNKNTKIGITSWILSTGMSFLAKNPEELHKHPHWTGKYDSEQLPGEELVLQSFLGIPVRSINGNIIGIVKAERRAKEGSEIYPFCEFDQMILQTLARVISKCFHFLGIPEINNGRRFDYLDCQPAITSWARDIVEEAVSTEGEMDSFLDIIVKLCATFMKADSCGIFLKDEDGKTLTQRAGTGSQQLKYAIRSSRLVFPDNVNQCLEICKNNAICSENCTNRNITSTDSGIYKIGVTSWIAKTGRSLNAVDYVNLHQHCHHLGTFDELNFETETQCGAFLGLPLEVGGNIIGVIKIENISKINEKDARAFSLKDQRKFNVLSQDIALAIKLLEEKDKLRFSIINKAMPTIFECLHGGFTVPDLVNRVVLKTRELFKARACALYLKEGNWLIQPEWAASGWASNKPNVRYYAFLPERNIPENPENNNQKVGLTVWIAVKKKKFIAKSNLQLVMHPHHKGTFDKYNFNEEQREKCESFMGVPLLVDNRLVGVLKVETKKRILDGNKELVTYFSEQDALVFDLIANSAAIAIENARLQEMQKLYEQIVNNPKKLLLHLHQYSHTNAFCITPLVNTNNRLQEERSDVKAFISHYQTLMQPEFDIISIDAFISYILKHKIYYDYSEEYLYLYRLLSQGLKACNFADISNSSMEVVNSGNENLHYNSILNNEINFVTNLYKGIGNCLSHTEGESERNREILDLLLRADSNIHTLGHPEQNIIIQLLSNWRKIVNTANYVMVKNPYRIGKPLSSEYQHLFFGRRDIIKWIAENLSGHVLLLHGVKRIGKSSILHQLENGVISKDLEEKNSMKIFPVFIDMISYAGEEFSYKIYMGFSRSIHVELAIHFNKIELDFPEVDVFKESPFAAFGNYVRVVCEKLQQQKITLVLLMDECQVFDILAGDEIIDQNDMTKFRSLLMNTPNLTCIMARTPMYTKESYKFKEMLDISLSKEVTFLEKEEAYSLIEKPVKDKVLYDKNAIEAIYANTNGQPYLIQFLCHLVIQDMNSKKLKNIIHGIDVENAINSYLFMPDNVVFDPIWDTCCDEERIILKYLGGKNFSTRSPFTTDEIEIAVNLKKIQVENALDLLLRKKLIMKTIFNQNTCNWQYMIAIPLYFKWVAYHKL